MEFNGSTLVFDLDGTISDPSLGIVRCFHYALEAFGLPVVAEELIHQCIGPPLDESFSKLAPAETQTAIRELVGKYRERYAEIGYAENVLYPGMDVVLEHLKMSGKRLGVCTSKRADFADRILSMFELREYFDFVSGGDIGIPKQSQLSDLLAAGDIDDRAIMIGDRAIDINAARHNSLRAVGVLWGFGSFQELSGASPVHILEQINALAELAY